MTIKINKSKQSPPQSQWKMFNYISSLKEDSDFNDRVKDIRKKFSLPDDGFDKDLDDELAFISKLPAYINEREEEIDFQKEVSALTRQFDLTLPWLEVIRGYVLYDDLFFSKVLPYIQIINMSEVLIEQEKHNSEVTLDEGGDEIAINFMENITDGFPIAIFLSPYATGKDIIDYVKKRYKTEIEPTQLKYRGNEVKIGKVRKRNQRIQERDAFICKHKNLPVIELVKRVHKQFGDILDYTYINKIIAKKCKKGK